MHTKISRSVHCFNICVIFCTVFILLQIFHSAIGNDALPSSPSNYKTKKNHKTTIYTQGNQTRVKIFKKLQVPRGTSLTLTAQVSKPKILPGFFFDDDGIILDAVIELPIWLDLDRFVDAMYNNQEEDTTTEGTKKKKHSFAGKERCFIYKELEVFLTSVLPVPKALPRACLLRAICEIQTMSKHYDDNHPQSLLIEMLELILSPSIGAQDECNSVYLKAESKGKTGYCVKYMTGCPFNILSLIMAQTMPPFHQ